jgi:hypothetical protein
MTDPKSFYIVKISCLLACSHGIPIGWCESARAFTPARQRVNTILPVKVPFCIRSKASIALFIGKTWPT